MPIVIDSNKDFNEQITEQTKMIVTDVTPKFFNSNFTGSPTRKTGHFNADTDSLLSYNLKVAKALYDANVTRLNRYENSVNDNVIDPIFEKHQEEHNTQFRYFANVPTIAVEPRLFLSTSNIMADSDGLVFDHDSEVMGIATSDNWPVIAENDDFKTTGRVFIASMKLWEKTIPAKSSGSGKNDRVMAGQPLAYMALVTRSKNEVPDAKTIITQKVTEVTPHQAVMTINSLHPDLSKGLSSRDIADNVRIHISRTIGAQKTNLPAAVVQDYSKNALSNVASNLINPASISTMLATQAFKVKNSFESITSDLINAVLNAKASSGSNIDETMTATIESIVSYNEALANLDESILSTAYLSDLYSKLKGSNLPKTSINAISKRSLRLLLAQRLHDLNELNKADGLYKLDPIDPAISKKYSSNPNYSAQQKRIILTQEPLVIGQAGAGSGKSHTLVGRINYIKDQGQDLNNVLVLSFTNVAATVISNRFPGIKSETLANMFNSIYNTSYPKQALSQPSTVANSISLLNPSAKIFSLKGYSVATVMEFIDTFSSAVRKFDQTGFKRVNLQEVTRDVAKIIESNMELTEIVLDAIEQTTLELQPIIIHNQLLESNATLTIPDRYQDLKYIITDESQDISTFEYILLLELTIHYKSQLLIIGDGSQTLYEFRNSDPRYMNALEASDVFTSYKLDVNYRSNQEILTFANQFLQVIEANDLAQIQLSSSSFNLPTVDSFKESIKIRNNFMLSARQSDYNESIAAFVEKDDDFINWVLPKLQNKEQVAILGWTRAEVIETSEALQRLMIKNNLDIPITNIMSDNERPLTIISDIVARAHKNILNISPSSSAYTSLITKEIKDQVAMKYNKASSKQLAFFESVIVSAITQVTNDQAWKIMLTETRSGKQSRQALVGHLTRELLRIETRKNAMDQYINKNNEIPNYDECPIIVSTIHGAKGLEFDHTIVLFNQKKKNSTSQESLRMFFVALSRAKKSEYIINSTVVGTPTSATSLLSNMFEDPMHTAYLRSIIDIEDAQSAQTNQPNETT